MEPARVGYWGSDVRLELRLICAAWILADWEPPNDNRMPELVLQAMRWIMDNVPAPASGWVSIPVSPGAIVSNRDVVLMLHVLEALFRTKTAFPGAAGLIAAWKSVPVGTKRDQITRLWHSRTGADLRGWREGMYEELRAFSPLFPEGFKAFANWAAEQPGFEGQQGRRRK